MSRLLKSVLLVSLLFNFFIVAAAGYFYYRKAWCREGAPGKHAELAAALDLTPEQEKAVRAEDRRFMEELGKTSGELAQKRERLLGLLKEEDPDRDSINALLAEINALQGAIEAEVVGHILKEKALLSKEQQERYAELLERRHRRARLHRERHR